MPGTKHRSKDPAGQEKHPSSPTASSSSSVRRQLFSSSSRSSDNPNSSHITLNNSARSIFPMNYSFRDSFSSLLTTTANVLPEKAFVDSKQRLLKFWFRASGRWTKGFLLGFSARSLLTVMPVLIKTGSFRRAYAVFRGTHTSVRSSPRMHPSFIAFCHPIHPSIHPFIHLFIHSSIHSSLLACGQARQTFLFPTELSSGDCSQCSRVS